jgi:hypothetical protein
MDMKYQRTGQPACYIRTKEKCQENMDVVSGNVIATLETESTV